MLTSSLLMVHEELKKILELSEELDLQTYFEGYLLQPYFLVLT